uniref:Uncharacterized protein n=1 Tax=Arundo donax TaxID=35708 RepID=A0A0A9C924_ARUDO
MFSFVFFCVCNCSLLVSCKLYCINFTC